MYDTPKITPAMCRNPHPMPNRRAVNERFRAVISGAVPEYGPDELDARAEAWTEAAIKEGAIIIEADR
jgi:hypothetical protein